MAAEEEEAAGGGGGGGGGGREEAEAGEAEAGGGVPDAVGTWVAMSVADLAACQGGWSAHIVDPRVSMVGKVAFP